MILLRRHRNNVCFARLHLGESKIPERIRRRRTTVARRICYGYTRTTDSSARIGYDPSADLCRSGSNRQYGVHLARRHAAVKVRISRIRRRQSANSGGVQEQTALSCRDRSHATIDTIGNRHRAGWRSRSGSGCRDHIKDGENLSLSGRVG